MAQLAQSEIDPDLVTLQCDFCYPPAVATNERDELRKAGWRLESEDGGVDCCPWCVWLERHGRLVDRFVEARNVTTPGRLPDLVIIGAAKAATTSMHEYLNQHPDIAMLPAKEPRFFQGPRYPEWLRLYRAQFDPTARLVGESSTAYTRAPAIPHVPERMARVIPDARLIYMVRDPVERAFAAYVEERFHGLETRSLERAFADLDDPFNPYLAGSRYATQLSEYLRHYDRAAIEVVASEDLRRDPRGVMKQIFSFLDVSTDVEIDFSTKYNTRDEKRIYSGGAERLRATGVARSIRTLPDPIRRLVTVPARRLLARPGNLEIPTALRAAVAERLADDIAAFRALVGRPFDAWSV